MKNWTYYNHAAIPLTAPHEEVDLEPVKNGAIWKMPGKPLLARWTSDFDCGYETNWWYCIKKAPYDYEALPRKSRKHIRQSLNKCFVQKVDPAEYSEQLWDVFKSAYEKYKGTNFHTSKDIFIKSMEDNKADWWAAFNSDGRIIGWVKCSVYTDWVNTDSAKFHPDYFKERASDALYHSLLMEYLNVQGKTYVSGGERTINHHTNSQEYKIETFQYQKAYCKLRIAYNSKIQWIIKCVYPFRKLLLKFDKFGIMHQLNAVLKMEEIVRTQTY